MKIDNSGKLVGGVPATEARSRATPARSEPAPGGDKVELSSLSSTLQKAEAAIEAAPTVDSARVAEIRQAIAEGRFKIDSSRIADGLLASVRQMLGDPT